MTADKLQLAPESGFKRHAEGMTFFGVPVKDMSRNDLLIIVGMLAQQDEAARAKLMERMDFVASMA